MGRSRSTPLGLEISSGIRFDALDWMHINALAKRKKISKTTLIRTAVKEYLAKNPAIENPTLIA